MHEGAENKGLWKPQIITKHAQTIDVGNRKLKYVFIVYIYIRIKVNLFTAVLKNQEDAYCMETNSLQDVSRTSLYLHIMSILLNFEL